MNTARRRLLWAFLAAAGLPKSAAAAVCKPTEYNALGPFYREAAPFRTVLASPSEPGEPLVISGRVLAGDGCSPLADAIVDAWHANAQGEYYNVGNQRRDPPAEYQLRGRVRTSRDGEYRFETILPGTYSLGASTRPRHVHFVVSHPAAAELVTQMYFAGDPHLEHDGLAKESLVVEKSGDSAEFDIVLQT